MPNLKDLRNRITSVSKTQKITSAMKMVAAAKLRRAQENAEAARPYAERMERVLGSLAESLKGREGAPPLLAGTGKTEVRLIVLMTSDRGLCGGFNSSIVRRVRRMIQDQRSQGNTVKLLCVGRKGRDQLRREYGGLIVDTIDEIGRPVLAFEHAERVKSRIVELFEAGEFDVCTLIYNEFRSAISQVVTELQLIPFFVAPREEAEAGAQPAGVSAVYEFEPDEEDILAELLPRNLAVQIFRSLLESNASEQGARMTAMDNATRNAGDMIDALSMTYNRTRQAHITRELIEIISGAEAL